MVAPNNPAILLYGTRTTGLWKSADRGPTRGPHTWFSNSSDMAWSNPAYIATALESDARIVTLTGNSRTTGRSSP
jgi:hypothetical protein